MIDASFYNETIKMLQDGVETENNFLFECEPNYMTTELNNDYLDLICGYGDEGYVNRIYACDNKGNIIFVVGYYYDKEAEMGLDGSRDNSMSS